MFSNFLVENYYFLFKPGSVIQQQQQEHQQEQLFPISGNNGQGKFINFTYIYAIRNIPIFVVLKKRLTFII